ncbi:MAG TPA: cysteine--tRNA ligase [Candidatus Saccharimonadales bacterium]|nr:cysteine--tRNA ligase [Candidatus Saccharimonadales bacterium]
MNLYNTLTKKVEELVLLKPGQASIYTCGPTVYNHVHIGNLASFIYADTLRRVLNQTGTQVTHVMNFTDVDDKTIKASAEHYSEDDPITALNKLTSLYEQVFLEDMAKVGNDLSAYKFIKATDYIEEMKSMISELIKAGFAYIAEDGIYFSIKAYQQKGKVYGQLSNITSSNTSEARINNDEYDKESAHDFALWKRRRDNEPSWEFLIDGENMTGRPGWHIECSTMSKCLFGQPFDIHTGGVDLIFPHHENEIAQSTALSKSNKLANTFFHSEHLLVDNQKMSKSLGNFLTINDITNRGYDPLAFRLLILQSHYSSQAHFSWENLEAAENRLYDLRAMAVLKWQAENVTYDAGTFAIEDVSSQLIELLKDNLRTPDVLALLSNVSTQLQTVLLETDMLSHFNILLDVIDKLLGLNLSHEADITKEQKSLISARDKARRASKWHEADEIRAKLEEQKIGLKDTNNRTIWFRLK